MARRNPKDNGVAEILAKKPWDEDDARIALQAFARSGKSQAGFARKHGFSPERLTWWRQKLELKGAGSSSLDSDAPSLLPVRVIEPIRRNVEPSGETSADGSRESGLEVVVGQGRRVRVSRGFDAETLYRVVEVLEVRSC